MAWILYVLGTGTLLAVAALALDAMLRKTKLPTRWVWVAALAGMAALAAVAPQRDAPFAPRFTEMKVSSAPAAAMREYRPSVMQRIARAQALVSRTIDGAMADADRRASAVVAPLAIAWLAATALMLSLLAIVTHRAGVARRRWPRADVRGVAVRVAPELGPAVIGLAKPDIVLPSWLMARPEVEQHLVVVHEAEHVAARDQLLPVGAWVVAALLPWHPAVWFAMSRLRLAIELDCDARVLHRGVAARSYGTLLIDIAGQCAGHRIGALALADRPSHLERRLLAMKKNGRARIGIARGGMLTAIAGLAIVMACEARMPTSSELDRMDVAAIEKTATKAMQVQGSRIDTLRLYTINDRAASEAEVKALNANQIATVNISKANAGKLSEVRITTDHFRTTRDTAGMKVMGTNLREVPVQQGLRMSDKKFDGLVYIDGVLSSEAGLAALSRDRILSIDVTKGEAASRISSDPAAINGIISVKTRQP
ncbi:MAG: M56 family metallopeptidase [Gemmatimonadaceae bacterium]